MCVEEGVGGIGPGIDDGSIGSVRGWGTGDIGTNGSQKSYPQACCLCVDMHTEGRCLWKSARVNLWVPRYVWL